jgi:hypothetical protein
VEQHPYEADVLADLEQQLFPEAVRRFRVRWCAGAAGSLAAALGCFALIGLAALPLLVVAGVSGGLFLVSRITDPPASPPRRGADRRRGARAAQPSGCSTKS